jgi:hypothetical protein
VNTSRGEGANAYIKRYIKVSNADIDTVFKRIDESFTNLFDKYEVQVSQARLRRPTDLRNK